MPNFAIIKNNVVENIIIADSLEAAISVSEGFECVEYNNEPGNFPYIGLSYSNGVFEQPSVD